MNNFTSSTTHLALRVENLSKSFASRTLLDQINLSVTPGERIAIVGNSGSGKSTLLHLLSGLESPDLGSIHVMDQWLTNQSTHQLSGIRKQYMGFVYQFHHLLSAFTLLENIALPLLVQGKTISTSTTEALSMLAKLGLSNQANQLPLQASGGERQRTAIGRALITKPAIVFADEPTGNLDHDTAHQMIDIFEHTPGTSLVIATHDLSIAKRMHRVMRLENGQLSLVTV